MEEEKLKISVQQNKGALEYLFNNADDYRYIMPRNTIIFHGSKVDSIKLHDQPQLSWFNYFEKGYVQSYSFVEEKTTPQIRESIENKITTMPKPAHHIFGNFQWFSNRFIGSTHPLSNPVRSMLILKTNIATNVVNFLQTKNPRRNKRSWDISAGPLYYVQDVTFYAAVPTKKIGKVTRASRTFDIQIFSSSDERDMKKYMNNLKYRIFSITNNEIYNERMGVSGFLFIISQFNALCRKINEDEDLKELMEFKKIKYINGFIDEDENEYINMSDERKMGMNQNTEKLIDKTTKGANKKIGPEIALLSYAPPNYFRSLPVVEALQVSDVVKKDYSMKGNVDNDRLQQVKYMDDVMWEFKGGAINTNDLTEGIMSCLPKYKWNDKTDNINYMIISFKRDRDFTIDDIQIQKVPRRQ